LHEATTGADRPRQCLAAEREHRVSAHCTRVPDLRVQVWCMVRLYMRKQLDATACTVIGFFDDEFGREFRYNKIQFNSILIYLHANSTAKKPVTKLARMKIRQTQKNMEKAD
jgi:hypothetical protein